MALNCCPPPPVKLRELRHVGTVKQPRTDASLQNDHGEIDLAIASNWATYLSGMYFALKAVRSSEPQVSDQLTGAATSRLMTRWSRAKAAITVAMKIETTIGGQSRTLLVAGPPQDPDGCGQWLTIPVIEEAHG